MREIIGFAVFIVLTLLTLFMAWFGLRNYGLNRPVSTYQTEIVKELSDDGSKAPIFWSSDPMAQHLLLPVQFESGQWNLEGDQKTDLQSFLNKPQALPKKILLFFSGPDPKALPQLRKMFKNSGLWEKTIFCSRFDGLLKDLRELEPEWSFCNGEIYLTRLLAFSSLGLESLLSISADVVFVHTKNAKLNKDEVDQLIIEGQRQNKLVIVGPVSKTQITGPWEGLKPHGWMVESSPPKVE